MIFHNPLSDTITHTFGNFTLAVEPGGEVDVAEKWVPILVSMGSRLAAGPAPVVPAPTPAPKTEPTPPPAPAPEPPPAPAPEPEKKASKK